MSQLGLFKSDDIFFEPVKLLIKESHAIFSKIPRNNSEMNRSNVITISRRYRSIVHECVENLTRDITNDHSDLIITFRELEVIWNLCEILLLDVNQTGTLIIQLKNWIKMHFDESNAHSKEILTNLDNQTYQFSQNDDPEIYWNLVTKLVLKGELKKTIQLLRCHYDFEGDDQLQLLANMLEKMPLSNQYIVHEFFNRWSAWSESCRRERDTGQFDNNRALLNIVRLLCQDLDVYKELAANCDSWYQLMVAYLLYTDPCIKTTDLPELCKLSIDIFKRNHPKYRHEIADPDEFDEIIISAFEYDLIQVIAKCCSHLDDNRWFVTHFIDLLHCSNQLKIHDIVESDKLRENFLHDYAETLFDDEQLWPIGVSYLDNCISGNTLFLETLLARIPLSVYDDVKAHRIISIAKKRNLNELSSSICRLMAKGWLQRTVRLDDESLKTEKLLPPSVNLSNALYWAVKSGDIPLTTFISDQYLYYYCKAGTFPDKSIFDSLTRSLLFNERLAFLAKYYEFKQVVESSELNLSEAGDLMKALLASKIYPRFFYRKILEDCTNLLMKEQSVFGSEKMLDLMLSVEEITKEGKFEEDVKLRQYLVKNMAKALISPPIRL